MLLRLLEDKNGEVQNLAVKCLGPLVNKVKEIQVRENFYCNIYPQFQCYSSSRCELTHIIRTGSAFM